MIKTITYIALFLGSAAVNAWSWDTNDNGYYESDRGNRYEYDLDRPADRVHYEHDINAQIRDRISPDAYLDRQRGSYGGGIRTNDY